MIYGDKLFSPDYVKWINFLKKNNPHSRVLLTLAFLGMWVISINCLAGQKSGNEWLEAQIVIFHNDTPTRELCQGIQHVTTPDATKALQTPAELSSRKALEDMTENPDKSYSAFSSLEDNFMVWLPPSGAFASIIKKLENSQNYSVLYVARWRMPLSSLINKGVSIAILPDQTGAAPQQNTNSKRGPIQGTISFYKRNFFYIQPELFKSREKSDNDTSELTQDNSISIPCGYPVVTTQRFIPGRLVYIDNPATGILFEAKTHKDNTSM